MKKVLYAIVVFLILCLFVGCSLDLESEVSNGTLSVNVTEDSKGIRSNEKWILKYEVTIKDTNGSVVGSSTSTSSQFSLTPGIYNIEVLAYDTAKDSDVLVGQGQKQATVNANETSKVFIELTLVQGQGSLVIELETVENLDLTYTISGAQDTFSGTFDKSHEAEDFYYYYQAELTDLPSGYYVVYIKDGESVVAVETVLIETNKSTCYTPTLGTIDYSYLELEGRRATIINYESDVIVIPAFYYEYYNGDEWIEQPVEIVDLNGFHGTVFIPWTVLEICDRQNSGSDPGLHVLNSTVFVDPSNPNIGNYKGCIYTKAWKKAEMHTLVTNDYGEVEYLDYVYAIPTVDGNGAVAYWWSTDSFDKSIESYRYNNPSYKLPLDIPDLLPDEYGRKFSDFELVYDRLMCITRDCLSNETRYYRGAVWNGGYEITVPTTIQIGTLLNEFGNSLDLHLIYEGTLNDWLIRYNLYQFAYGFSYAGKLRDYGKRCAISCTDGPVVFAVDETGNVVNRYVLISDVMDNVVIPRMAGSWDDWAANHCNYTLGLLGGGYPFDENYVLKKITIDEVQFLPIEEILLYANVSDNDVEIIINKDNPYYSEYDGLIYRNGRPIMEGESPQSRIYFDKTDELGNHYQIDYPNIYSLNVYDDYTRTWTSRKYLLDDGRRYDYYTLLGGNLNKKTLCLQSTCAGFGTFFYVPRTVEEFVVVGDYGYLSAYDGVLYRNGKPVAYSKDIKSYLSSEEFEEEWYTLGEHGNDYTYYTMLCIPSGKTEIHIPDGCWDVSNSFGDEYNRGWGSARNVLSDGLMNYVYFNMSFNDLIKRNYTVRSEHIETADFYIDYDVDYDENGRVCRICLSGYDGFSYSLPKSEIDSGNIVFSSKYGNAHVNSNNFTYLNSNEYIIEYYGSADDWYKMEHDSGGWRYTVPVICSDYYLADRNCIDGYGLRLAGPVPSNCIVLIPNVLSIEYIYYCTVDYSYRFEDLATVNFSVKIPDTIEYISYSGWPGSYGPHLIVGDDNPYLISYNGCVYSKSKTTLYYVPSGITNLIIAKEATVLEPNAFFAYTQFFGDPSMQSELWPSSISYEGTIREFIENGIYSIYSWWSGVVECSDGVYEPDSASAQIIVNINGLPDLAFDSFDYIQYISDDMSTISLIGTNVTKIPDALLKGRTTICCIYWGGTIEEWEAVEKGDNWALGIGTNVVHCTDGDVPI